MLFGEMEYSNGQFFLFAFLQFFFFLISVNNRGAHNTGGFGSMHAFQGRQNTVTHLNANRSYD